MTVKEAAAYIGMSPGLLRWRLARRLIQGEKLGRDWIIPNAEAERIRAERECHGGRMPSGRPARPAPASQEPDHADR